MHTINNIIANKLRVRVCGLCLINQQLLLIKHTHLDGNGFFWAPPGGGIHFGEALASCLKREFLEETYLPIEIGNLIHVDEFITEKYHAVEVFYKVNAQHTNFKLGHDPEFPSDDQLMTDIHLFTKKEIQQLPNVQKHKVLQQKRVLKLVFD